MMKVWSTVPFTALRIIRSYIVLLLLLVVPIVLLTIFHIILSGAVNESGEPYMNEVAVTMVLVFQLFGGSIVMSYIQNDFFTASRARLVCAPFNRTMYAFSIMMCGTAYSVLLGVALMAFTQFALGVAWTNWFWAIYLIVLMAILSSIVCLIFTFTVKSYKVAERLSELYGIGFVVLAGMFFPMPDNRFFEFMGSYGNPLTLSMLSIQEMGQANTGAAWMTANILLAANGVLFVVMLALGRRRLG